MAPRRSEPDTLLDAAAAHLRVGSSERLADAVTRSHLADFRCVGWYGAPPDGWAVVIDAEVASATVPERLAIRFGVTQFWERWTRAECLCKLAAVPMLAWWPKHGLDVPSASRATWRTLRVGNDIVVSVAVAPLAN